MFLKSICDEVEMNSEMFFRSLRKKLKKNVKSFILFQVNIGWMIMVRLAGNQAFHATICKFIAAWLRICALESLVFGRLL